MSSENKNISLSKKDELVNASQALVKSIPWIGAALDQVIFGRLSELRLRRIELTLQEIANKIQDSKNYVDTEEFANLLENVTPALVRATGDKKRERLRDLLLNAATHDPQHSEWAASKLAAELIEDLDEPALLAISRLATFDFKNKVDFVSLPSPQFVYAEIFDWDKPEQITSAIQYEWPILEEWMRRLREKRIVTFGSHDARGGFGNIQFTALGNTLIKWIIE